MKKNTLVNRQTIWNFFNDLLGDTILHPQYFIKSAERRSLKEVVNHKGGVFLDIGCGRQWYRANLEPLFDKYYGLDSPITRKKYISNYPVELKADVTKIPLPEKSVDLASMIMVLEHLPDPEKALSEVKRTLKKNGKLIICTVENYPGHDFPYNYYHWTKFGLKQVLERAGFKIEKLISFGNFWETQVVYQNVYLMHLVKTFPPLLILFAPIMILGNISAIILGRRAVSEEYALGHIVIAFPKSDK